MFNPRVRMSRVVTFCSRNCAREMYAKGIAFPNAQKYKKSKQCANAPRNYKFWNYIYFESKRIQFDPIRYRGGSKSSKLLCQILTQQFRIISVWVIISLIWFRRYLALISYITSCMGFACTCCPSSLWNLLKFINRYHDGMEFICHVLPCHVICWHYMGMTMRGRMMILSSFVLACSYFILYATSRKPIFIWTYAWRVYECSSLFTVFSLSRNSIFYRSFLKFV